MKVAVLERALASRLGRGRFQHSLRVKAVAERLAAKYFASRHRAAIAGLLHDCAKELAASGLIRQAKVFRLPVSPLEKAQPKLLHAPISAQLARVEFGVRDKGILLAIATHTLGQPAMSRLQKIIYLADHIEPARRYPGVRRVRYFAGRNIDRAVAESARAMLYHLLRQRLPIDLKMVETLNYYLKYAGI